MKQADPTLQVMVEHDNVIDCVQWAPPEAAKIIEQSDYYKKGGATFGEI